MNIKLIIFRIFLILSVTIIIGFQIFFFWLVSEQDAEKFEDAVGGFCIGYIGFTLLTFALFGFISDKIYFIKKDNENEK